jgi:hypothetical protein
MISLRNTKICNISLSLCLESGKSMHPLFAVTLLLVRILLCCAVIGQNTATSFLAGCPAVCCMSRFDPFPFKLCATKFLSLDINSTIENLVESPILLLRRENFVCCGVRFNWTWVSKPLCFQCLIVHRKYIFSTNRKISWNYWNVSEAFEIKTLIQFFTKIQNAWGEGEFFFFQF